MTISLTPKLEALIDEKVRSGRYASASEVVREALHLLAEIEKGINSGPSIDGEEAFRQIDAHMAAYPNGKPTSRYWRASA